MRPHKRLNLPRPWPLQQPRSYSSPNSFLYSVSTFPLLRSSIIHYFVQRFVRAAVGISLDNLGLRSKRSELVVFGSAPGVSEVSVPQGDHFFVPQDPGLGAIGLGGGLSPNFEPSAVASVEGLLASEQHISNVGMCICCLKHLGSDKEQECV